MTYVNSDNALQKADGRAPGRQGSPTSPTSTARTCRSSRSVAAGRRPDRPRERRPTTTGTTSPAASATCSPSTARSSASPRSSTTWPSSTTRTCSQRPACPSRRPTGRGTTSVAAAKALTDPAQQVFGLEFPVDGSETDGLEVHRDAVGGRRRHPERGQHGGGVQLAAGRPRAHGAQRHRQDGSMYLDSQPDSGSTGSCSTPARSGWSSPGRGTCPSSPTSNYGVQVMPSFDPGGSHETIAGPDNWVILTTDRSASTRRGSSLQLHDVARSGAAGFARHGPPADARVGRRHVGVPGVLHDRTRAPRCSCRTWTTC